MLVKNAPDWADIMPDGESLLLLLNGELLQRSIADGSEKKLRRLDLGEVPMEWTKEPGHLFVVKNQPMSIRIDKVDLGSDRRETWYEFKPKNQDGALLVSHQSGITLDGRWMIFDYWVQLGQFYESENLR